MPDAMEATPATSRPGSTKAATNGINRHGSSTDSPSASLHAARKPPAKPWKKPAAQPIPPRVYRVDPWGFRELVQRLTGATDAAPRRLRDAAPAPLDLGAPPRPAAACPSLPIMPPAPAYPFGGPALAQSSYSTAEFAAEFPASEAAAGMMLELELEPLAPIMTGELGFPHAPAYAAATIPSPTMYSPCLSWCNVSVLSPGSLACLEQSTVL